MRYGENVDEVMENDDWICPGCRDICNCSFCRIAKVIQGVEEGMPSVGVAADWVHVQKGGG